MLCAQPDAKINEQTDQYQLTALMPAAQEGHIDVVKYLHSRGADPDTCNRAGGTALLFAAKHNRLEIVRYLLDEMSAAPDAATGTITALYAAAEKGWIEMAQMLIAAGADVNAAKANGASSLLVAAEQGHAAMVLLLCDHGADMTAKLVSCRSDALMIAARQGRADMLRTLITKFPELRVLGRNNRGATALHTAAHQGHLSRRRDCHSAASPSPFSRRFNRDREGTSAK